MTANINSGGQNRVPLYDNLKVIGIVLVILGHVTENNALGGAIYAQSLCEEFKEKRAIILNT